MISRRNYFTITIVMFIVFFLFQFSNVALESWNHYEENSFITDTAELPDRSDIYGAETNAGAEDFAGGSRETVVYIGEREEAVGETVSLWAVYTKRTLEVYSSLEEYGSASAAAETAPPAILALDAAGIDWSRKENCDLLKACTEAGTNLIFCNLPEPSELEANENLQTLLGIQTIRAKETAVTDIYLYKGFLLGGETYYSSEGMEEGMDFTFPWYELSQETDIYMSGFTDRESTGVELAGKEMPPVIWRNDCGTASVFAVNGSYMEDVAGLGILSAMSAKMGTYEIYPVVNAQNVIYANYPGLADENEEILLARYGQSMKGFFQNVVWPDAVAVRRESNAILSCMLAPQFDYQDDNYPDAPQFERYMKLLNEQRAETGLSGTCLPGTSTEEKLAEDYAFMQEALPDYWFTSFYAGSMTEEEIQNALQAEVLQSVRTVVEDCNENKEVIGYLSEYITRQSAVIDGFEDSARHDFRIRCLETALGYNSILVDMERVVYPEGDGDEWVNNTNTLRQNLQDYRIGRQGFENTAVSECDIRIRSFLALDYRESREFNSIRLELNDVRTPVWFVLRTDHETIESMEGGSWKKLEEDAYLIEIEQESAVVTLKSAY